MVILPKKNEKDLRDVPEEIRKSIKLVLADSMDQVLEAALRRRPKPLVAPAKAEPGSGGTRHPAVRPPAYPTDQPAVVV
jgi:ATP-dependent Lon protease